MSLLLLATRRLIGAYESDIDTALFNYEVRLSFSLLLVNTNPPNSTIYEHQAPHRSIGGQDICIYVFHPSSFPWIQKGS